MPETLVSYGVPIDAAKRKEMAIEYWQNFLAWFNTAYPQMQKTNTINAYRSFLAAHNINFAHGEGKRYGLSTTSERLGEYKDIMLTPDQIDKMNRKLENKKDWESWSFMNINLHTGARAFAMASMSRDRIAFSPLFRIEQFESKTKRGDWYLTKEGKWWVKYPTEECRAVVETAYDRLPKENSYSLKMLKVTRQTLCKPLILCQRWLSNSKGYSLNLIEAAGSMKKRESMLLAMDYTLMVIRFICSGIQWLNITWLQQTGHLLTWQAWADGRIQKY